MGRLGDNLEMIRLEEFENNTDTITKEDLFNAFEMQEMECFKFPYTCYKYFFATDFFMGERINGLENEHQPCENATHICLTVGYDMKKDECISWFKELCLQYGFKVTKKEIYKHITK